MTAKVNIESWQRDVESQRANLTTRLHSIKDIVAQIKLLLAAPGCPLNGIRLTIKQHAVVFNSFLIGSDEGYKKAASDEPLSKESSYTASISVEVWAKNEKLSVSHWFEPIRALLEELWGPAQRQTKWGLLEYQNGSVQQKLATIGLDSTGKARQGDLYVVYFDLDGFKALNDQVGHATGDQALIDVSSDIEHLAHSTDLLAFNKGGDEFGLIIRNNLSNVLEMMQKLHDRVMDRSYGTQGLRLNFTAGMVKVDQNDGLSISEYFDLAEACTKDADLKKKKGTISLHSNQSVLPISTLSVETFVKFGAAFVWIHQANDAPFANVYLNAISASVTRWVSEESTDLSERISGLLNWIGIRTYTSLHEGDLIGQAVITTDLSPISLSVAIAHGVLHCANQCGNSRGRMEVAFTQNGEAAAVLLNQEPIWGEFDTFYKKVAIADAQVREAGASNEYSYATTLALQVGFTPDESVLGSSLMRQQLFCDTVIVDDRPKLGGGLPDFWQAAIAHVYATYAGFPNLTKIAIIGDPSKAPETVQRLRGEIEVNTDEIASVTMLSQDMIQRCKERITVQNIVAVSNLEELIRCVYDQTLASPVWQKSIHPEQRIHTKKMRRRLDEGDMLLRPIDGTRCLSAAQAYPLVVEMLRTSDAAAATHDDASQALSEIVGYKLAIEQTLNDPIPEYWLNQKTAFDAYADEVLLQRDSLIGKHLYENGQFDAFISQLASYCAKDNHARSTRRAILVVPNLVENDQMRPLGLVSIWATPRYVKGAMTLEFCFVWRTVEVLVGLPYSLYGSIKFAHLVRDEIQKKLESKEPSVRITAGGLTYLALSLHMRTDEFHRRIAKRIVDAASD